MTRALGNLRTRLVDLWFLNIGIKKQLSKKDQFYAFCINACFGNQLFITYLCFGKSGHNHSMIDPNGRHGKVKNKYR
jgi:hypothetical protein